VRLKNYEKDFEFNAGGEGKPMQLLCHKRGDARETGKKSNESRGGVGEAVWIGDNQTIGRTSQLDRIPTKETDWLQATIES